MEKITGYKREDGSCGIRNHLLILPLVVCANSVVEALSRSFPDAVAVTHPYGCTFDPVSNREITDIYIGLGRNPNIGAVLLISLGCETIVMEEVVEGIRQSGKPVEALRIQAEGGTIETIAKGTNVAATFKEKLAQTRPSEIAFDDLVIGTECGASDSYSGLTANPVVGYMSDRFIDLGSTVILTEVTEFIGADEILSQQCINSKIAQELLNLIKRTESYMAAGGYGHLIDITPGNIAGGLTTIEEKSLGCIRKGGTRRICEVVSHGRRPREKGLVVMDAPGHDVESMVAMAAGGAQLIFFTTGRGTPTGCPGVPVIKVSSNSGIFNRMGRNIDFNAGDVIEEGRKIEEVGEDLFRFALGVINGQETKSEIFRCREFAIRRMGVQGCIV